MTEQMDPTVEVPSAMRAAHAATSAALWSAAWSAGGSGDHVLDALTGTGHGTGLRAGTAELAARTGLPGPGEATAPMADLLPLLRDGGPPGVLLPVAGDVRGLQVGGADHSVALDAGAVLVLPTHRLGLVPHDGLWRGVGLGTVAPPLPLRDARLALQERLERATRVIAALQSGWDGRGAHAAVDTLTAIGRIQTPPGTDHAAEVLLGMVVRIEATLAVTRRWGTRAASAAALGSVEAVLAPLATACRDARRSAVAAAVRSLVGTDLAGGESQRRETAVDHDHRSGGGWEQVRQ